MGVAIGASSVVRYKVDVRYWECPLSEVPLYVAMAIKRSVKVIQRKTATHE